MEFLYKNALFLKHPVHLVTATSSLDEEFSKPLLIENEGNIDYIFPINKPTAGPDQAEERFKVRFKLQPNLSNEFVSFRYSTNQDMSDRLRFEVQENESIIDVWAQNEVNDEISWKYTFTSTYGRRKVYRRENEYPNIHAAQGAWQYATGEQQGSTSPINLVAADVGIAKPTGNLPSDGETFIEDFTGLPVFLFDTDEDEGKCVAVCEVNDLDGLDVAKQELVWSLLEWKLPKVGDVEPGEGVPAENGRMTTFTYPTMPEHNDDFGNYKTEDGKDVVLRFKDRHEWVYKQDVQFRYRRGGSAAADQHHELENGVWKHVNEGDPNWYVYWTQVAMEFSHEESGTFGPQAAIMEYIDEVPDDNKLGEYEYSARFLIPPYDIAGNPERERIRIFKPNNVGIVTMIKTIHHENGHRQYFQKEPHEGGWGENITYWWRNDVEVEELWAGPDATPETRNQAFQIWNENWDMVHKEFEKNNENFDPNINNSEELDARHHAEDGLCVRNENHVQDKSNQIKEKDWSYNDQ